MTIMHRAQLAIVGVPGSGKTTLANALGEALRLGVLHTDSFIEGVPWAEQADEAMKYIPVRGIIEGITVARMFRRGFEPDCVIALADPLHLEGPPNPSASIRSLIRRGLDEYLTTAAANKRPARLLRLQQYCTVRTALLSIGRGGG